MSVEILDGVEQALLDVGCGHALDGVAQLLGDQLRGIGVDHVGDLVHRTLLHQQADDVDRAFRHAVGEFLDGDGFRDNHLADQLLLRLVRGVALEALGAAAERGDRALAHVVGSERGDHSEAPALLLRRRLVGGLRRGDGTHGAARPAAHQARALVFFHFRGDAGCACRRYRRAGRWSGCRRRGGRGAGGLSLAETLLGFEFGLALGLFVVAMALFLGLAAGFGGFAFGLLDAFAAGAALGFLFRHPPFFHFANAGIGERADARGVLVLGQRAEHHAGGVAQRGGLRAGSRAAAERRLGGGCGLGDDRFRRVRSFSDLRIATDAALAALFDHHLLGPAVGEALAHGARLDARLERQGLARNT